MDDLQLQFYGLLNSISVTFSRPKSDNKRLRAMEPRLPVKKHHAPYLGRQLIF